MLRTPITVAFLALVAGTLGWTYNSPGYGATVVGAVIGSFLLGTAVRVLIESKVRS